MGAAKQRTEIRIYGERPKMSMKRGGGPVEYEFLEHSGSEAELCGFSYCVELAVRPKNSSSCRTRKEEFLAASYKRKQKCRTHRLGRRFAS